MAAGSAASRTADREIVISRLLDAPRELVFRAWTDPDSIGKWWGPTGFTTTTHAMEFKPGGVWRFVMHGPDGTDFQNEIVYTDIVEPERICYKHGGKLEDFGPIDFEVTVTLELEGGKTRLTMRTLFPTAEGRDHVVKHYGAIEGGNQTLARLAEHLKSQQ